MVDSPIYTQADGVDNSRGRRPPRVQGYVEDNLDAYQPRGYRRYQGGSNPANNNESSSRGEDFAQNARGRRYEINSTQNYGESSRQNGQYRPRYPVDSNERENINGYSRPPRFRNQGWQEQENTWRPHNTLDGPPNQNWRRSDNRGGSQGYRQQGDRNIRPEVRGRRVDPLNGENSDQNRQRNFSVENKIDNNNVQNGDADRTRENFKGQGERRFVPRNFGRAQRGGALRGGRGGGYRGRGGGYGGRSGRSRSEVVEATCDKSVEEGTVNNSTQEEGHSSGDAQDLSSSSSTIKAGATGVQSVCVSSSPLELTPQQIAHLRITEIAQFKKLFPRHEVIDEEAFNFVFVASDPDWPFDVRDLSLKVDFPADYPESILNISIRNPDEVLPELMVEHLDNAIKEWIKFYHQPNRLSFRPFLKWLDRNLQVLFIESLRKVKKAQEAKVEVVIFNPSTSMEKEAESSEEEKTSDDGSEGNDKVELVLRVLPKKHERLAMNDIPLTKVSKVAAPSSTQLSKVLNHYDPSTLVRRGIEIKFRRVELSEDIAMLVCDRLFVTVQCKKCKKIADFTLYAGRKGVTSCAKCQTKIEACFRPGILHQVNPVLGYLDLTEGTIHDVALSRSHFYMDCLHCSKLTPFEGLHYGQKMTSNCLTCNTKRTLVMDSIKFFDICKIESRIKQSAITKKDNMDNSIQAGKPLPNTGSCKHYKKSFRWFRFPCCGKAYPCDECHNEQEDDHVAEFASRMICGFCAKEQPFSNDKPCSSCYNLITGRRTSHWEGGKGCRSKVKMSTNDPKKFSGLSKTISRKATQKPKK